MKIKILLFTLAALNSIVAVASDLSCNFTLIKDDSVTSSVEVPFDGQRAAASLEGFNFAIKTISVDGASSPLYFFELTKGKIKSSALFEKATAHPFITLEVRGVSAQAQCAMIP
jgi:hypothetical protein